MKVGQIGNVSGVYGPQGVKKSNRAEYVRKGNDKADVSISGKEMSVGLTEALKAPDIRPQVEAKMNEISKEIDNGTYLSKISGKSIIDNITKSMRENKID